MKSNLKINKNIQKVSIFALILVLAVVSVAAISPANIQQKSVSQMAIANYIVAQHNPNLSDEEKIKAAIDAYFTTRYEGQKLLVQEDFSQVLEDDTLDWVKKEKDKREIELYVAVLFDLKYVSYNYTLDYDSIEIKNNKATVQLRENHQVVFDAIAPEVSELANLQHIFTLHNKKGVWGIYKDEYQDELSRGMEFATKEELRKKVDENYQEDLARRSHSSNTGSKVSALPFVRPFALTNYSYNRTAAVNYADAHWSSYYTTYYKTETQDCTNYVSQAMYAGEGKSPPDTSGICLGQGEVTLMIGITCSTTRQTHKMGRGLYPGYKYNLNMIL